MLDGRDVIVVYGPPWDDPTRVSKHHLAAFLARRNRVLYVESSLHPLNLLARPASGLRLLLRTLRTRQVGPTLYVRRFFNPIPYHAATWPTATRAANRLGQHVVGAALRRELARLDMRSPVLIAGLPHAVDLLPQVPASVLVYHCADEYRAVRGFPAGLAALERELVQRADLVVVTSQALLAERRGLNPRTHWIPNGVDVDHFARARAPETPVALELTGLPRPIVGFVGAIASWVDLELVAEAAAALPGWSFVLVGPGGDSLAARRSRPSLTARLRSQAPELGSRSADLERGHLRSRPNVHLLGPRPYAELPRYLKGFDVGIIPFKPVEVARKADPIKLYEYLAAGLPVVATDIPGLGRFADLVEIAREPPQFVRALELASVDWSAERVARRMAEGRRHTWEARFTELSQLLAEAVCAAESLGQTAGG